MSETIMQASVADLLGGSTDDDLDITFPAIGENPYHTTMYRLLHRLMTVVKAVNQLRVYKDGDLSFGVRSGRASRYCSSYDFAGASQQSLSDDADNFIYLSISGGELALNVNITGFPDAAVTPHVPLAVISTGSESIQAESGSYDIDDIDDMRGSSIFTVLGS